MAAATAVLAGGASLLGLGVISHVVREQSLLARFGESPVGIGLFDHLRLTWPVAMGLLVAGATCAWLGYRRAGVLLPLIVYLVPGLDFLWSAEVLRPGIVSAVGAIDLGAIGPVLTAVEAGVLVAPAWVIGRLAPAPRQSLDVFAALALAIMCAPVSYAVWYTAVYSAYDGRVNPIGATVTFGAVVAGFVAADSRAGTGALVALSYAVVVRRSFLADPYPLVAVGAFLLGMAGSQAAAMFRAGWRGHPTALVAGSAPGGTPSTRA